ncbi:MAG: hypothetical protein ACU833_15375 [Gammaproteobacteria bacterium]
MTERMTTPGGQAIGELCKRMSPGQGDQSLLAKIQSLAPDLPVRLAKTGDEWYRIGGVADRDGRRVSNDLIEWVERTFIECGQNFQTLIDHALEQELIATRQIGRTLYFVIETGEKAGDFILLEIDKTQEVSDRLLINEQNLPEDLEDIIDPLIPAAIENFHFGHSRYHYRRKTDIGLFMETLGRHHSGEHPVKRFMDDWDRSSASKYTFCRDWIVRPYQHTGRYGEQIVNAEIVNLQTQRLPHLEDMAGKHGNTLSSLLTRFDRHAGYPFAWFFYMVKGKLVSPHNGEAVYRDISGDFAYLPERDEAVLRDWIASPYNA